MPEPTEYRALLGSDKSLVPAKFFGRGVVKLESGCYEFQTEHFVELDNMNNYFKPTLKNLSQGARLEYVRKLRYMSKDDVADYFDLGGERKERTISRYENNSRVPSNKRLEELAKLYNVSINAIKEYKYEDPIDTIYMLMWLEEQFPYYELNLDYDCIKGTSYNMNIQKGLDEWMEMREQRENGEITTDEYIEWKLNFSFED